jgi:alkanesulfonate monooxygenase SsuD/methylene tetrahydromethanopterin reductase-like flavin-dependent oxidoreductase (luciferase family)
VGTPDPPLNRRTVVRRLRGFSHAASEAAEEAAGYTCCGVVGVGWGHVEYEALGQDLRTRGVRQEEQIEGLRRLCTVRSGDRAAVVPKPARPLPIWLGESGEKAFERAARLADGFIVIGGDVDHAVDARRSSRTGRTSVTTTTRVTAPPGSSSAG